MKKIRYIIEAIIVKLGLWIFYILGKKAAPNIASKIAIFIGKKLKVNKLAYDNISKALPHLSEEEKEEALTGMWDNLGRIVGEYPHVARMKIEDINKLVEIDEVTRKNLEKIKNSKEGGIIFSGHIGNWEVGPKFFLNNNVKVSTVYRPLNNPHVEKMTASIRGTQLIPKSSAGNRKIIANVKKGEYVIILADQKISEGEAIKFFHDEAITTTSIARIALKYNIPLIPARSIRVGKEFKFKIEVQNPLEFEKTTNSQEDIVNLTCQINQKLEEWISQYPAQWFWVHDRWKK